MNKQGTLFAEEARHGVPYNEELKWVCDSCGDVITTPTLKGCRSIEAQQWTVVLCNGNVTWAKAGDVADTLAEDARVVNIHFHFIQNKLGRAT